MDEYLAILGKFRKPIVKDGSCLFRCVSDHQTGRQMDHLKVRKACVDYVEKHADHYKHFLDVGDDITIEVYIDTMRLASTWAGHIEIDALKNIYGFKFSLFRELPEPGLDKLFDAPVEDNECSRMIRRDHIEVCYAGNNHYDLVYPLAMIGVATFTQGIVYEIVARAMKLPSWGTVAKHELRHPETETWRPTAKVQGTEGAFDNGYRKDAVSANPYFSNTKNPSKGKSNRRKGKRNKSGGVGDLIFNGDNNDDGKHSKSAPKQKDMDTNRSNDHKEFPSLGGRGSRKTSQPCTEPAPRDGADTISSAGGNQDQPVIAPTVSELPGTDASKPVAMETPAPAKSAWGSAKNWNATFAPAPKTDEKVPANGADTPEQPLETGANTTENLVDASESAVDAPVAGANAGTPGADNEPAALGNETKAPENGNKAPENGEKALDNSTLVDNGATPAAATVPVVPVARTDTASKPSNAWGTTPGGVAGPPAPRPPAGDNANTADDVVVPQRAWRPTQPRPGVTRATTVCFQSLRGACVQCAKQVQNMPTLYSSKWCPLTTQGEYCPHSSSTAASASAPKSFASAVSSVNTRGTTTGGSSDAHDTAERDGGDGAVYDEDTTPTAGDGGHIVHPPGSQPEHPGHPHIPPEQQQMPGGHHGLVPPGNQHVPTGNLSVPPENQPRAAEYGQQPPMRSGGYNGPPFQPLGPRAHASTAAAMYSAAAQQHMQYMHMYGTPPMGPTHVMAPPPSFLVQGPHGQPLMVAPTHPGGAGPDGDAPPPVGVPYMYGGPPPGAGPYGIHHPNNKPYVAGMMPNGQYAVPFPYQHVYPYQQGTYPYHPQGHM